MTPEKKTKTNKEDTEDQSTLSSLCSVLFLFFDLLLPRGRVESKSSQVRTPAFILRLLPMYVLGVRRTLLLDSLIPFLLMYFAYVFAFMFFRPTPNANGNML